jgi:hypothetical protein
MESYEALQKAIAGRTMEHAKRLGKSTSLLTKWQEPHTDFTDSGAYNPLDRIEAIVDTAIQLGVPRESALAPVHWVNHRFGLVCFDMPDTKSGTVSKQLLVTIKEFSDVVQETSKALLNNRIDKGERATIITEGQEAIRAIGALIGAVKAQGAA